MTEIWAQAALWLGLALLATLASIWLRVATALSEIVVGTIAQLIIGAIFGGALLAGDPSWLKFLAGAGALLFPINWPEPFGLVMIEAMACGTPVIAYPSGSVPEVLEESRTGFLVNNEQEADA